MPIDTTKPLAILLREGTQAIHDLVAFGNGAKLLNSGQLSKREYIRYLMMLWHVYDCLERCLDAHPSNPILETTYNPSLLARSAALSSDISYLSQLDEQSWKAHPVNQALLDPSSSLSRYLVQLRHIASTSPISLLAHSYVRYLGDLSGGQTIRHILSKAYGLDEASGEGLSFYAFRSLHSTAPAGLGEMKRIKEWFREGLNAAGELGGPVAKETIVSEARTAFILSADLLQMIREDKADELDIPDALEPVSKEKQPYPSEAEASALDVESKGGYSVQSVAAVIAAMCLTHFILVVGGFTGDRGYEKLMTAQRWLMNLWQST